MNRLLKPLLSVISCRMPRRYESQESPPHLRDSAVCSPSLNQLDQRCEIIRPIRPRFKKVTVIGASSDVGLITCLFLKQHSIIHTIAMYEDYPTPTGNVIGHANDIAHIDTMPWVEAYQGTTYLPAALRDAQVVLICGGAYACAPCCKVSDYAVFNANCTYVRHLADAIARFAPEAIVCVQTPPVDATFNIIRLTLKRNHVYNKRKLLGVNSITAMRGNQLYCALADLDPAKSFCPCVGGTGRCARVPCFSVMDKFQCVGGLGQIDVITRLVREADDLIYKVKCNHERAHLSIGFSTARLIVNIMQGLWTGSTTIDSALVEQSSPESCYDMKICASPLEMGYFGITTYKIPKLSPKETELLELSKPYLDDMLYRASCFIKGEECKVTRPVYMVEDCPVVEQSPKIKAKKANK